MGPRALALLLCNAGQLTERALAALLLHSLVSPIFLSNDYIFLKHSTHAGLFGITIRQHSCSPCSHTFHYK